mmetsp:Transcript_31537/g.91211  ORF Transcript_31537/g.91211 Transcript_31537/m.91211 type:complete len:234 (-) Transcript_31537:2437-3138(-)
MQSSPLRRRRRRRNRWTTAGMRRTFRPTRTVERRTSRRSRQRRKGCCLHSSAPSRTNPLQHCRRRGWCQSLVRRRRDRCCCSLHCRKRHRPRKLRQSRTSLQSPKKPQRRRPRRPGWIRRGHRSLLHRMGCCSTSFVKIRTGRRWRHRQIGRFQSPGMHRISQRRSWPRSSLPHQPTNRKTGSVRGRPGSLVLAAPCTWCKSSHTVCTPGLCTFPLASPPRPTWSGCAAGRHC